MERNAFIRGRAFVDGSPFNTITAGNYRIMTFML